eukprot:s4341_g3.t1
MPCSPPLAPEAQRSAQHAEDTKTFNGSPLKGSSDQPCSQRSRQKGPKGASAVLNSISTETEEQFLKGEDLVSFSFSFVDWCMSLTRWSLKSRTGFGHFLSTTLSLTRDGPTAAPTALFPLPLPVVRPYAECPEGSRGRTVYDVALDRALHVMISALNYMYWSRSSPPLDLLRRQPNELQAGAIAKLRQLLKACDPGEPIQVAGSGRRNLQLMARLQELALAAESLGLMRRPYQEPEEVAVPLNNLQHPQLNPFSNLQPSRLKISGRGHWDVRDFLDPELYMPFVEPQSIELEAPVFERGLPNFSFDKPDTVFELFQKWDELGLLVLHPRSEITTGDSGRVKIFNSYKSSAHDRQIGDRRERNAWEGKIPGPSAALPVGPLIGRLVVPPGFGLITCVTDRSDYYHQIAASYERSRTNVVWPPMPLAKFLELRAYDAYKKRATERKRARDRTVAGDFLGGYRPGIFSLDPATEVFGAFGAILQGDHLGVEFGISAHVGLLQSAGLLGTRGRLVADALVRPSQVYQGLCIDDFFSIAPVPLSELESPGKIETNPAKSAFDRAKKVYADYGLAGSDPKDVINSVRATVVGAQVDSRAWVAKLGFLPVGAPVSKRLALSWIAATSARLPVTSDALHSSLVGGLVSVFCFRKCCMSFLQEVFKVIPAEELCTENPKSRPLSRQAAEEMILSAVLIPLAHADVKAPFHKWLYASDASTAKGAFCQAVVEEKLLHPLWLAGDFKGAPTFLDSWQKHEVKEFEGLEEEDWLGLVHDPPQCESSSASASPSRPLAQYYDFIEVCGGSGVVSEQVAALGYVVGPIIDLTYSEHYDLLDLRAVEWLLFMVQHRRVRSVALEPPCTTFSPAAYPPCRSYKVPRGFNQRSSKVWVGNRLCFACLTIFMAAAYAMVLALLETPRRSKMAWLEEWRWLLGLPNVEETYTASCSYGSPFQKEFRFLTCNMRSVPLRSKRPGASFLSMLDSEELFCLAELPKLRRWISNWTCLFLGLCLRNNFRFGSLQCPSPRFRSPLPPVDFYHHILDFDSTLGFPGEGPPRPVGVASFLLWILLVVGCHGMRPRNKDDERRASLRQPNFLHPGRPVTAVTRTNRDKLLEQFKVWLLQKHVELDVLLSSAYSEPETLVSFLVAYGRELYSAGRPYNHYAETINAIAAAKPTVRRLLTAAWDLAFSWVKQEPGEHHTACPFQILLALLSTAIFWGWPAVAGVLALSWGAVCRIGEVMSALRQDLVLPADVLFSSNVVYLKVQEPKTRYKAARHQISRLDYEDLVSLVSCAFADLASGEKLWPFSGQLLRTRFRQLLAALGLPTQAQGQQRPLDLGSMRAGGATHLLMITEDSEVVRRRGRWLAHRTMDVYLQEVAATILFPHLPGNVKAKVLQLAHAFPGLLEKMKLFYSAKIPPSAWYHLLRINRRERRDIGDLEVEVAKAWHAEHKFAAEEQATDSMDSSDQEDWFWPWVRTMTFDYFGCGR